MPFLFDTDAISEVLRPRPLPDYVKWLRTIPREEQHTSAVCVGELFKGAFRSSHPVRHLENIRDQVLPALTVLPFDAAVGEVFGHVAAHLEESGKTLPDADLQIAATALYHGLELVTENLRHFQRIQGLRVSRVLAEARG
jgi:predicted nucleic acid-binding protein